MAKYRKKPVVIDAVRWDGKAATANAFIGDRFGTDWSYILGEQAICIPTLEGNMRGEVGDWIIKGVKGEFYPCKNEIFEATYDSCPSRNPMHKATKSPRGRRSSRPSIPDLCPMGCGRTTEDPLGGPCKACWAAVPVRSAVVNRRVG